MNDLAKILIVDSNKYFCKSMDYLLSNNGYKVYYANCGADAIDIIHTISLDLIILNLKLPDMNGYKIFGNINNDICLKRLPIFIISEKSNEEINGEYSLNVSEYITRPVDTYDFLHKVTKALNR